ncbi:hypothetical protein [Clostridium sp. B9]
MKGKIFSILSVLSVLLINAGTTSFATVGLEDMPESLKKNR